MDVFLKICGVISALVGLFAAGQIIWKILKKRYKLDCEYKNIYFATFPDPYGSKNEKCFCLIFYDLHIVNNADRSNTLKNIILSYKFNGKKYQEESHVVHTKETSPTGEPVLVLSHGPNKIHLGSWHNILPKLGERKPLQPGDVFSGSAIFLFESHVKDIRLVKNLELIVTNFNGGKSTLPIPNNEEWFNYLNTLSVENQ